MTGTPNASRKAGCPELLERSVSTVASRIKTGAVLKLRELSRQQFSNCWIICFCVFVCRFLKGENES